MRGAESFMGAGNGICSRTEVLDVGEDLGAEAEALVLGMHDIAHALDVVVLLHLVDVRLEAVRVDRAADDRSGDRLGGVSAELADEAGLDFETVSQREWVNRLRNGEKDPEKNPTIKLLDFFTEKYDNDRPGRKGLVFLTDKTAAKTSAIGDGYDVVGSGLIKKFVDSWSLEW